MNESRASLNNMHNKWEILSDWAQRLTNAAHQGTLTGQQVQIRRVETVAGPRAGAVELHAGVHSGRLLRALSADDCALARQFIPFPFAGEPAVYMTGRYVRVEAGWPPDLAETLIRLTALGAYPKDGGRWIAGKNEHGQTITLGLSDKTPHFLLAGATGSGKSVALRACFESYVILHLYRYTAGFRARRWSIIRTIAA